MKKKIQRFFRQWLAQIRCAYVEADTRKPKVYVAGPMRHYVLFNFPAFDRATTTLQKLGWCVYNPAEMDRAVGIFEDHPPDKLPAGFFRSAMRRDLTAITDCEAIALLPGWEASKGVHVELTLAAFLDLDVIDAVTGAPLPKELIYGSLKRSQRN